MLKKLIFACVLTLSPFAAAFGQQRADSVRVHFNIGRHNFEPSLGNNAASMDDFINKVKTAGQAHEIDHIEVRSYCSPDGTDRINERLAVQRSEAIARLIAERAQIDGNLINTTPEGVSWPELRRLVEQTPDVPAREKVLDIIDNTPIWVYDANGRIVSSRKKQLMDLRGGRPYKWLLANVFPKMRNALAVTLYLKSDDSDSAKTPDSNGTSNISASLPTTDLQSTDSSNISYSSTQSESSYSSTQSEGSAGSPLSLTTTEAFGSEGEAGSDNSESISVIEQSEEIADTTATSEAIKTYPPYYQRFALKTNMLYYAILLPNVELEWLINKHWSVAAEGNLAQWGRYSHNKSYRLTLLDAEGRYWIKPRAPWHGMYVGLIGGGGWYDLQNGSPGHYGWGVMTGVSFGYMWPIGRKLSLEAEIGAGYLHSRYKDYEPIEGHHVYLRTKELNYFGPIKLKFSIAWRFADVDENKHNKTAK